MAWTKRRFAAAAGAYLLLLAMHPAAQGVYLALRAIARLLHDDAWGLRGYFVLGVLNELARVLLTGVYPLLVLVGTLFGGAIAVMRIGRRAAPGTAHDPLIQLRDALRAHRLLASVLPWTPFAYWLYKTALAALAAFSPSDHEYAVALPLLGVATTMLGKMLLRALDRVESREDPLPLQLASDETAFRAVAVTPRSQAVVAGALALAVAMIAFISSVNLSTYGTGRLGLMALVYATVLGVTARWYQTASKIRVGTDGVFVQGTSKTRFYSYRDFDAVRVSGATLHLLRGAKSIVRLQLHGADLHRGAFLAERIETALAAAMNISGAESLVGHGLGHGHSPLGATDYRSASLSREQLWELIEADGTAGSARTAAAQMLAADLDSTDRTRLRVAAAHMADPQVRIALEAFARPGGDGGDEEDAEVIGQPVLAARLGPR